MSERIHLIGISELLVALQGIGAEGVVVPWGKTNQLAGEADVSIALIELFKSGHIVEGDSGAFEFSGWLGCLIRAMQEAAVTLVATRRVSGQVQFCIYISEDEESALVALDEGTHELLKVILFDSAELLDVCEGFIAEDAYAYVMRKGMGVNERMEEVVLDEKGVIHVLEGVTNDNR